MPLKTDAAERVIDLAPELTRELAMHSLASSFSKPGDFFFATETGQPRYYRNVSARGLDKAADRAGLNPEGVQRLSFHDPRHTAITHLIRSGADAAQVSRFAGHSKVSITLDCTWASSRTGRSTTPASGWRRSTPECCRSKSSVVVWWRKPRLRRLSAY